MIVNRVGSAGDVKRRQDKRLASAQMITSKGGGDEERPQKNRGGTKERWLRGTRDERWQTDGAQSAKELPP